MVFQWTQHVCQFSKKFEGGADFFVDLVWNDPHLFHSFFQNIQIILA